MLSTLRIVVNHAISDSPYGLLSTAKLRESSKILNFSPDSANVYQTLMLATIKLYLPSTIIAQYEHLLGICQPLPTSTKVKQYHAKRLLTSKGLLTITITMTTIKHFWPLFLPLLAINTYCRVFIVLTGSNSDDLVLAIISPRHRPPTTIDHYQPSSFTNNYFFWSSLTCVHQ